MTWGGPSRPTLHPGGLHVGPAIPSLDDLEIFRIHGEASKTGILMWDSDVGLMNFY